MRISDWSSDVCSSDLLRMVPGSTATSGGYELTFQGVNKALGPNYKADVGDILLSKNGQALRSLHPEKRTYFSSDMPMTEAAIDANGLRHVYVALGEPLDEEAWGVRIYYKPFVDWIWIGSIRSEEHTSELQSLMRNAYAV